MLTTIHSCPSCSSVITFRSADTDLIVCPQCGSRLQRLAGGLLRDRDELAKVEDTFTPIQVGTTGTWNGQRFTVIGRIRCLFVERFTNSWSILFDNGTLQTLSESGGLYVIYEKIAADPRLPYDKIKWLSMGSGTIESSSGSTYILERKEECVAIEVEGEVEIIDWDGKFAYVQIASLDGDRIKIINAEKGIFYYRTYHLSIEAIQFQQLRPLPVDAGYRALTCNQCNKSNELRSYPFTQSFACQHCNAALSIRGKWVKYRRKLKQSREMAMPLQAKGKIKDIEYEIVGFAVKEDTYGYSWREYILFNSIHHYAFLSEYNGHWIFLREIADAPVIRNSKAADLDYRGETFLLYNEYRYSIQEARGEFPGDVFNNADPHCREFISPPEMWAREMQKDGFTWYHGEHISANDLYKAFGAGISLPFRIGSGAVQPVKGYVSPQWLKRSVIVVSVLLFVIFGISTGFNRDASVFSQSFDVADSASTFSTVTPKFILDKTASNLEIQFSALVSNNWAEANITLVNADNGKEYSTELGVEYYAGYEDGESWSEGSKENTVLLTSIPKGNYFIEVIVSKPEASSIGSFHLEARYDVPMWSNFWIFLVILLLPGLGLFWYIQLRERARWSNSNFSPYNSSGNDE